MACCASRRLHSRGRDAWLSILRRAGPDRAAVGLRPMPSGHAAERAHRDEAGLRGPADRAEALPRDVGGSDPMVESTAAEGRGNDDGDGVGDGEEREGPPTNWIKLSASFRKDDKVLGLTLGAEMLFISLLLESRLCGYRGVFTWAQVRASAGKVRNQRSACEELVSAQLLAYDGSTSTYRIPRYWKWSAEGVPEAPRRTAEPAGRKAKSIDNGKSRPRAAARASALPATPGPSYDREEESRVEVPNRTPSGSVRLGTAPDARRDAEGDARPARRAGGEVVGSSEIDPRALARAEVEKGRKLNPAAGRKFNYRPELPSREPTAFQSVMAKMDEALDGSE